MESYWEAETETEDFGERQFEAELNSKTNWFSQIIALALKKIEERLFVHMISNLVS